MSGALRYLKEVESGEVSLCKSTVKYKDEADPQVLHPVQPSRSISDPLKSLSKQVSAKLEEDDYRGVVHAAHSEDTMAVLSPNTISALQQKHPPVYPQPLPFHFQSLMILLLRLINPQVV